MRIPALAVVVTLSLPLAHATAQDARAPLTGSRSAALFADQGDATTSVIVAIIAAAGGAVAAGLPAWLTYRLERGKIAGELASTIQREKLSPHPAGKAGSLAGVYKVMGFHAPTSVTYGGEVEITPAGGMLRIRWKSGGRTWEGVGIFDEGVLSCTTQGPTGQAGVVQYLIDSTASPLTLRGKWAYPSDATVSSETLTRTV